MKYIIALIACALAGCAASGPKPSDLICTSEQCSASLEQHPGQTDWFIVIDSDCGIVKTANGKELAICGGERWVGDGDIEIVSGSCRVCARQVPGNRTARRLILPRSLVP